MAKRWIQQKKMKMKIYREKSRGIMKSYSSATINVGRTVNKMGMEDLYRDATRGLHVSMTEINKLNFTHTSNEPRQAARELREQIRNGTEPLRYFRILDDAFARARLYYSLNPEFCYLLELDRRKKKHRRSIRYTNRDLCLARYFDSSIDWVSEDDFYHSRIPETFPPSS